MSTLPSIDPPGQVLVVDDSKTSATLLANLLTAQGYRVSIASDGVQALDKIAVNPPDLVLLDVIMPGIDGFEVCRRIKENAETRLIPVVMITGLTALDDKVKGIEAGAEDFISKPFQTVEVLARAKALIRMKRLNDELDRAESVIMSLARTIEAKDHYTQGHIERVTEYAVRLGQRVGLLMHEIEALRLGGALHDVGKVGVPDAVLNKPDPLAPEEWELIRQHTILGESICASLRSLQRTLPIIRWHHERLDGSGYPDGLRGDEIPIPVRVMTIADIYDALSTARPYKPALPLDQSAQILRAEAQKGKLDGDLVEAFIHMLMGGLNEE